jgi:hypothetical protein
MANAEAWNQGWALGSKLGAERRERRQQLSDEEFQFHASRLADELAGNRKQLAAIDREKQPKEYAAKTADMQRSLQDLRELFHPAVHPGALAKFGFLLLDSLHLTSPQKRIHKVAAQRAAAVAGDQREAEALARSTPGPVNTEKQYKNALIEAGFTEPQAQKALEVRAGVEPKAAEPKVTRPSAFDESFLRFLKARGIDSVEDASAEDEAEFRKSLRPTPAAKPVHQSDYLQAFARYLREHHIPLERATSKDEMHFRALWRPVRPVAPKKGTKNSTDALADLKAEAAKRRPRRAKKPHSKTAHPAYQWQNDPSSQPH